MSGSSPARVSSSLGSRSSGLLGHYIKVSSNSDRREEETAAKLRLGMSPEQQQMMMTTSGGFGCSAGRGASSLGTPENASLAAGLPSIMMGAGSLPRGTGSFVQGSLTKTQSIASAADQTRRRSGVAPVQHPVAAQPFADEGASNEYKTIVDFTERYRKRYGINPFREQVCIAFRKPIYVFIFEEKEDELMGECLRRGRNFSRLARTIAAAGRMCFPLVSLNCSALCMNMYPFV